jgi:hypothetical protein
MQKMGDVEEKVNDQQVYDWIAEHGLDGDLDSYRLPSFESWRRFRNRARKERDAGKPTDSPIPRSAVDPEQL